MRHLKHKSLVLLVAGVVLAVVVACTPLPDPQPIPEADGGFFYAECDLDHSANDDPIVKPGEPGASHLHDFFGGRGVTAYTEPEDLLGGPTSCLDVDDTAAYWTPSLEIDGVKIEPTRVNVRYSSGGKDEVAPWPTGMKVVAGLDDLEHAEWGCKGPGAPSTPGKDYYPCGSSELTARIDFPDCLAVVETVDGRFPVTDSTNHRDHVAYSYRSGGINICPVDHPYPVPALSVKVHYGKNLPDGVPTLGNMGMPTTDLHADFLSAWDTDRLAALVEYCIVGNRNCGESSEGPP